MFVKELIEQLQKFDSDNLVECTWEGTVNDIEVYQSADGVVMIDGDHGYYRVQHQKLPCDICSKPAAVCAEGVNLCWAHHRSEAC